MSLKKLFMPLMALMVLSLCSCNDEKEVNYSSVIKNTKLVNILKEKGYTFTADGKLELNDLAMNTEKLDLSGTNIQDFAGLEILPNLKELKLSKNGYGPVFDFTKLPTQITAVDLTENEIFDFEGLVDYTFTEGDIKDVKPRNFTKLYLPATAKYNIEDLVPYYMDVQEKKNVDLQMVGDDGKLAPYNTIRRIPDDILSKYIKLKYPSVFVDDHSIDISKPAALNEHHVDFFNDMEPEWTNISSIEGLEYFINNPFYPDFSVIMSSEKNVTISYLMPNKNIKTLSLYNINTPKGIELKKATGLFTLILSDNNDIKKLDVTNTLIGNQPREQFDFMFANSMILYNCPELEEVKLNTKGIGDMNQIEFVNLPKLKSIDLSNLVSLGNLYLVTLPKCNIKYPMNFTTHFSVGERKWDKLSENTQARFSISQDVLDKESTKSFLAKYGKFLSDDYSYCKNTYQGKPGEGPIEWKKLYK